LSTKINPPDLQPKRIKTRSKQLLTHQQNYAKFSQKHINPNPKFQRGTPQWGAGWNWPRLMFLGFMFLAVFRNWKN